jgi:hypothetical protein
LLALFHWRMQRKGVGGLDTVCVTSEAPAPVVVSRAISST